MEIELEELVTEEKFRANEQKKFMAYLRDFLNIALVDVQGDPPDTYILSFNLAAYRPDPDGIKAVKPHAVRITLPSEYPNAPPLVNALTPLHHPAVNPADGSIDVSGMWASTSSPSLRKLVNYLARLITGGLYNVPDPPNPEAVAWYEEHADDLPLDEPVRVPEQEEEDESVVVDPSNPCAAQIRSILGLLDRNQFFIAERELADLPPDLDFDERDDIVRRIAGQRRDATSGEAQGVRDPADPAERHAERIKSILESLEENDFDLAAKKLSSLPPDLEFAEKDEIVRRILRMKRTADGEAAQDEDSDIETLDITQFLVAGGERAPSAPGALGVGMRDRNQMMAPTYWTEGLRKKEPEKKPVEKTATKPTEWAKPAARPQQAAKPKAAEKPRKQAAAVRPKAKTPDPAIMPGKSEDAALQEKLERIPLQEDELEQTPLQEDELEQPAEQAPKKRKALALPKLSDLKGLFTPKQLLLGAVGFVCVVLLGIAGILVMQDSKVLQRVEEGISLGKTHIQAKRYAEARGALERAKSGIKLTVLSFKKDDLIKQIDALLADVQKGIAAQKRLEEERAKQKEEELAAAEAQKRQAVEEAVKRREEEEKQQQAEAAPQEQNITLPTGKSGLTPAELLRERNRVEEAMNALLPAAKKAFEQGRWEEAAELYRQTLALAEATIPEVRESMNDFLLQVERLRDLSRIRRSVEEGQSAAARKDQSAAIRWKNDALNQISRSKFSQDEQFAGLAKQLQDQMAAHKRDQAESERIRALEARGMDYIISNFPQFKKEHLSRPKATFLRREGSRFVYRLSTTDRSQGRPTRLTLVFAYDEKTGKWQRLRE